MIVLLAAGVGISLVGLIAIGFGIPISDTSFGNALLIAGVVILCTGLTQIGLWLAVRELLGAAQLALGQGAGDRQTVRVAAVQRPPVPPSFAAPPTEAEAAASREAPPGSGSPPPWADEMAARARPRPAAAAPEPPPLEPESPPPAPVAPDRPARRNLLFASRKRDGEGASTAPVLPSALEAEPKVSFENAWPPLRANGSAERVEPTIAPAEPTPKEAEPAPETGADAATETAKPPRTDLPPGVTVVRSGTVDEMAYTYYSDGSIEAQLAGESPIRFASLDELRTYVEQRR